VVVVMIIIAMMMMIVVMMGQDTHSRLHIGSPAWEAHWVTTVYIMTCI